jgi:hypothetical protein
MNIVKILENKNHLNLHHLTLENSSHAEMPVGDDIDRTRYIDFVTGLYNMYM